MISINEDPSREVILGQNPDLLLSYGLISTGWADLKAVGINELTVGGQCDDQAGDGPNLDHTVTFENFYRDIGLYGQIFGTQDVARAAVADLRKRVETVKDRFRGVPARTAATLSVYPSQVYVYGKPSVTATQLTTLGLTNAFEDVDSDRYIELNIEQLLARNPDVLVVGYQVGTNPDNAMAQLRALPGADRLTAVREGHLIPVESQSLVGGLYVFDGLEAMASKLAGFG